jgi:hypothetical protein
VGQLEVPGIPLPQPSPDPRGHLQLANRSQKKLEDVPDHPTIIHWKATPHPNCRTRHLQNRTGFLLQPSNSRQKRQNPEIHARELLPNHLTLHSEDPPVQFPTILSSLPLQPHFPHHPNLRNPLHNPNLPDPPLLFLVSRPPCPLPPPPTVPHQSVSNPPLKTHRPSAEYSIYFPQNFTVKGSFQ